MLSIHYEKRTDVGADRKGNSNVVHKPERRLCCAVFILCLKNISLYVFSVVTHIGDSLTG